MISKGITSPTGPFAMPVFRSRYLSERGQYEPQESQNPFVKKQLQLCRFVFQRH
jgi:hypothetical protein